MQILINKTAVTATEAFGVPIERILEIKDKIENSGNDLDVTLAIGGIAAITLEFCKTENERLVMIFLLGTFIGATGGNY